MGFCIMYLKDRGAGNVALTSKEVQDLQIPWKGCGKALDTKVKYYGEVLVLDDEEAEAFAKGYGKRQGTGLVKVLDRLTSAEPVSWCGDNTGRYIIEKLFSYEKYSSLRFFSLGDVAGWRNMDSCYVVLAGACYAEGSACLSTMYRSISQILEEYRRNLSDYLPEKFDYKEHIGLLIYSEMC